MPVQEGYIQSAYIVMPQAMLFINQGFFYKGATSGQTTLL